MIPVWRTTHPENVVSGGDCHENCRPSPAGRKSRCTAGRKTSRSWRPTALCSFRTHRPDQKSKQILVSFPCTAFIRMTATYPTGFVAETPCRTRTKQLQNRARCKPTNEHWQRVYGRTIWTLSLRSPSNRTDWRFSIVHTSNEYHFISHLHFCPCARTFRTMALTRSSWYERLVCASANPHATSASGFYCYSCTYWGYLFVVISSCAPKTGPVFK